jgi:UDPglucose 6-dehydrogenase
LAGDKVKAKKERATKKVERTKVSVIGAGYVGLVTGLCLADMGFEVVCIDAMSDKVHALSASTMPFHEEGLEAMLKRNLSSGRFRASSDMKGVEGTDITFICVGTPSRRDGTLDTRDVVSAASGVGRTIRKKDGYHVVAVKSTVPPGTLESQVIPKLERQSGKRHGEGFGAASNPEFLREGSAVQDFLHPDRIVIGTRDMMAYSAMLSLYSGIDAPLVRVTPPAAEMIKLASNAFLAARVSLINEIGNLCKELDIDVREVAEGVGMDRRIGKDFLRAGCGFGGSCFPKDVKGLAAMARQQGIDPFMLDSVVDVNEEQPLRMLKLLERHLRIKGSRIGVLGLAFKPGTDDVREAPSLKIVKELLRRGAEVFVHDYEAMDNFRQLVPDVKFCRTPEECVRRSDALLIVTEWPGYSDPSLYGDKLVIDGRGVTRTNEYEGVCW